tara:strand:+ start:358 stop:840 length:483 start_codon:yes stop_codon:yes gene_type:complete
MKEVVENFYSAIRNGDTKLIDELITKDPSLINIKDQRGSTPLILATYYGHGDLANLLLERGADIDGKDGSGNTALMGVCFKGFAEIAKKLVDKGAKVNVINAMGATSLIYTAMFNKIEIAKILLNHGADTSIKDARGQTAYDHAKLQGNALFMDLVMQNR